MNQERTPAVAGLFYSSDPQQLARDIRRYVGAETEKRPAMACLVPHAGYVYSGPVAGAVYRRLEIPRRVLMIGPNHTGMGVPLSIMARGRWTTPLGPVAIDSELALELQREYRALTEDSLAHLEEHALEVQLPFLQVLTSQFTFVPIAVGVRKIEVLQALGEAIASVLSRQSEPVLILVSSDMNHYESDAITRAKDRKALDSLLALHPQALHNVVTTEGVSMCGCGPAVAMLVAAKLLGARTPELVRYATSAEFSGDFQRVVGYAGVIVR